MQKPFVQFMHYSKLFRAKPHPLFLSWKLAGISNGLSAVTYSNKTDVKPNARSTTLLLTYLSAVQHRTGTELWSVPVWAGRVA